MKRQLVLGVAVPAAILLVQAPAAAQQTPTARAAEALFNTARELVDKGDFAGGCPIFEASLALLASPSTMIHVAQCHEHEGKVATASADYGRALALSSSTPDEARRKAFEDIASKAQAALEPQLPRLLIAIAHPPADVVVTRDGAEVPAASLGRPLPADPGRYEIRVSAPGFRAEARTIDLEVGKTTSVDIALVAVPVAGAAPPGPPPPALPAWALAAGAAGIALVGAGVAFRLDEVAAETRLMDKCTPSPVYPMCAPPTDGYAFGPDNARKNRDFGLFVGLTAAGVAGVAAAVVGIVATGRRRGPVVTPVVSASAVGVSLSGAFR
jgi:hypothetical protein